MDSFEKHLPLWTYFNFVCVDFVDCQSKRFRESSVFDSDEFERLFAFQFIDINKVAYRCKEEWQCASLDVNGYISWGQIVKEMFNDPICDTIK
jgi:hypothetical protein